MQTKCRSFLAISTLIHRRLAWETWRFGLKILVCIFELKLPGKRNRKSVWIACNCTLMNFWSYFRVLLLVSKRIPCHSSTDTGGYIIPWQSLCWVAVCMTKNWGTKKKASENGICWVDVDVLFGLKILTSRKSSKKSCQTPEALRSPECVGGCETWQEC